MEDQLRDRINKCLCHIGPYRIGILCSFGLSMFVFSLSSLAPLFYNITPSFHCGGNDSQLNICEEEKDLNCTFDPEEDFYSVVTEYNLICHRRYLVVLSGTVFYLGVTIGSLVFGALSDRYGRKLTLLFAINGLFLSCLSLYFEILSPAIEFFVSFRFVEGFFSQGMMMIAYTYAIEMAPIKCRSAISTFLGFSWAVAIAFIGFLSSIVGQWRLIQLSIAILILISLCGSCFLPESMHWLLTKGRFQQAIRVYTKYARLNCDKRFLEDDRTFQEGKDWGKIEEQRATDEETNSSENISFFRCLKNAILRKHLLILVLYCIGITAMYYTYLFIAPPAGANRVTSVYLSGGLEIVMEIVTAVILINYKRPLVFSSYAVLSAIFSILYGTLYITNFQQSNISMAVILATKGFAGAALSSIHVYALELFPTTVRGTMYGICVFSMRLGNLIAPSMTSLMESRYQGAVAIAIGGITAISGLLILYLPETRTVPIPNTIQDAENLWGKKVNNES